MADFRQFLMIFLLEFINIGPVHIRGWARGGGVGGGTIKEEMGHKE